MENEMPVFLVIYSSIRKTVKHKLKFTLYDCLDLFCFEWLFSSVSGFADGVILNFKHITNEVRKNKTTEIGQHSALFIVLIKWCIIIWIYDV